MSSLRNAEGASFVSKIATAKGILFDASVGQRSLKKSPIALASPNALSTCRRTPDRIPDRPYPRGLPPHDRTPLPLLPHLQLPPRRQPLQTHLPHLRLLPKLRRLLLAARSLLPVSLFVIPQRSGGICGCCCRCLSSTHPNPKSGLGGCRKSRWLVFRRKRRALALRKSMPRAGALARGLFLFWHRSTFSATGVCIPSQNPRETLTQSITYSFFLQKQPKNRLSSPETI